MPLCGTKKAKKQTRDPSPPYSALDMASGGADSTDTNKRNLVVDEAAFEEQFLRCHICREKYDQAEKTPKSLPCNHTFCLPCLKQIFDHNQQNTRRSFTWAADDSYEGVLKCPTCRVEIFLSRSEISALPNDHRVIQMMDFLSQVVVKAQNVCSKHERQPLNFFCKSCLIPVCRDCTVLDHKEQAEHVIVDVSQALTDNSDEFNNVENRSKQLLQSMKTRSDALANASKRLDLQERQLRGKIKDTFIEYRLLLERRQESQIDMLHDLIKKQKSMINTRFVDVCTQGSQLQKLYDSFVKARPSNDITQLFTAHKQIKEREDEFAQHADANDDELFVGCEFEVINEPIFLSEMSGLGDVTQNPDMELKNPVPAHQLYVLDMEERRIQESAQDPHPECDDIMVTGVEPSPHADVTMTSAVSRVRRRAAESAAERAALRATRYRAVERERERDIDEDEADEMEHDANDIVTSEYLLRIASRLTQSSANLSEAILDLSTDRDDGQGDDTPSSTTTPAHSSTSSRNVTPPSGSRRSQNRNVRVVRHPQQYGSSDRSERYLSASRYGSHGSSSGGSEQR